MFPWCDGKFVFGFKNLLTFVGKFGFVVSDRQIYETQRQYKNGTAHKVHVKKQKSKPQW